MAETQYLAISNPEDEHLGHIPFVADHMDGRLQIIDPVVATIAGHGLSYTINNGESYCEYGGTVLNNVISVWDRRPTVPSRDMFERVAEGFRNYAYSAVQRLAQQMYVQFPGALWVSDRFAVQRAELKSVQLAEAARLGLPIPDTLMTSDPQRAESFIRERDTTIIKPLGVEGAAVDETLMIFFSTRVTPNTELSMTGMNFGPVILQSAVEAAYDVRATVVGNKVFPAAITSATERSLTSGVRDWRIGYHTDDLRIEECDMPPDVTKKCIELVKTLGLQFGAIDIVVDSKGKHWFIENNPNGQWAFIEEATKQPIGKAMAGLLLAGKVES